MGPLKRAIQLAVAALLLVGACGAGAPPGDVAGGCFFVPSPFDQCRERLANELAAAPIPDPVAYPLGSWRPHCPVGTVVRGPERKEVVNGTDLLELGCVLPDGTRYGPYAIWTEYGDLRSLGRYDAGEQDGRWVYYHSNGRAHELRTYRAGVQSGLAANWHDSGRLLSVDIYQDGRLDGPGCTFGAGGSQAAAGVRRRGTREGRWRYAYRDGTRAAEGRMVGGRETGLWRRFHPDGSLSEEACYERGLLHGRYVAWDDDGFEVEAGRYQRNRRHGRWRRWFWTEKGVAGSESMWSDGEHQREQPLDPARRPRRDPDEPAIPDC